MDDLQRRHENRLHLRQLRDASNPFAMPNDAFRKLYRFPRESAHNLFLQLSPFLENGSRITKIPKVVRFVVALHFYAQGSYQSSIGTDIRCSMSQPAVSRCIKDITNVIINNFAGTLIRFPSTADEINHVKNGFFQKFNFPGIIGVIDGSHISIVPPAFGGIPPRRVFLNRKNFCSINCQIICDSDLKILGICARYPGSVHDSAIWMMSTIYNILKNHYRNGERHTWLIGDSGYPLQPFLLTPILNTVAGTPEYRYTKALCRARNSVERCIGVLKGVFRCLLKDRALHYKPRTAAKITIACATLYNILRNADVEIDNLYLPDLPDEDDNENINEQELHEVGVITRNYVIRNHFE